VLGKLETGKLTARLQDAKPDVFQISRLGEVPFVLAFNPDHPLTLKVENMLASAVLAHWETYGFQYESTPQGIVVT
jgi:hypothetical protein